MYDAITRNVLLTFKVYVTIPVNFVLQEYDISQKTTPKRIAIKYKNIKIHKNLKYLIKGVSTAAIHSLDLVYTKYTT